MTPGGPNTTDPGPAFEILEHTADVGIIAHGRDLPSLFANAGRGMFALMVDLEGVEEREERQVEVEGRDLEGLMVRWLSELLYYLDAEEMVFRRFEVAGVDGNRLSAKAFGERIDRQRHLLHFGVKAVTRHMLEVVQENGYRATILFDI